MFSGDIQHGLLFGFQSLNTLILKVVEQLRNVRGEKTDHTFDILLLQWLGFTWKPDLIKFHCWDVAFELVCLFEDVHDQGGFPGLVENGVVRAITPGWKNHLPWFMRWHRVIFVVVGEVYVFSLEGFYFREDSAGLGLDVDVHAGRWGSGAGPCCLRVFGALF